MATLMMTNLKKLSDFALDSDLAYPTKYKQMIGCLIYLINNRIDICFVVNTLS
jgi:hypothetical protein